MNDEFLHALRRDPPPAFAHELQRRLQRASARRSPRSSVLRTILAMLLIGGFAMATALLLRDRQESSRKDAPVTRAVEPKAPTSAGPSAVTARPNRQVTGSGSADAQPQPQESAAKGMPVAIVTSSLARPLTQALVEPFSGGYYSYLAQPRVVTMDDDEALRALCGNGTNDFAIVSRRISTGELGQCHKWGFDVIEWKLGYQAVVVTASPAADAASLTPRDVFLALARRIPDPADTTRLIDNPNVTWHDVDARLDYRNIDILMPVSVTTRAAFQQLLMEAGCETYPWIRTLRQTDRARYYEICHQLRGDGRYREVELSNTLLTQQLWAEPNWLIVLDYSSYAKHRTELLGTILEGPPPTLASLSDGTYAAARPVYVYAQRGHLDSNPAARMLAYRLTEDLALGQQSALRRQGLVPLEDVPRSIPGARPSLPPPLESLQPEKEHAK